MFIFILFILYIVYAYANYDNNNTTSNNNKTYTTDTTTTNTYCVYLHTVPNGKRYVGITKQNPPSKRWGVNGKNYEGQYFYNAIQCYGWDSISHEILYNNLSEREARLIEHKLIKRYRSTDYRYGYNIKK